MTEEHLTQDDTGNIDHVSAISNNTFKNRFISIHIETNEKQPYIVVSNKVYVIQTYPLIIYLVTSRV